MTKKKEADALALETLKKGPPASQLTEPLDYIFAEHFRQRVLCNVLDCIADQTSFSRSKAAAVARFLKLDFATHIVDEEEDLFPMLRRRAEPEDRIEVVIGRLSQEHSADKLDADEITKGLSAALADRKRRQVSTAFSKLLHRFAANERHHLTVENAIVLPLARVRLTADDLRNLGHRMASRRGINFQELSNAI